MPDGENPLAPRSAPSFAPPVKKTFGKHLGTAIGAVMLLLILVFIVRVVAFYRLIQKGELLELPQFQNKITRGRALKANPEVRSQLITGNDPALGSETPLITVVEFADFECPYSREAFTVLREMAAKYGDRVRVVYRDFPLEDIHTRARGASIAASCAGKQNKFWQMHDKLYQHADALTDSDMAGYAEEIGLNLQQFNLCLLSDSISEEVDRDLSDGAALQVAGTPTFFINGQKIEGAIPRAVFDSLLSGALTKN